MNGWNFVVCFRLGRLFHVLSRETKNLEVFVEGRPICAVVCSPTGREPEDIRESFFGLWPFGCGHAWYGVHPHSIRTLDPSPSPFIHRALQRSDRQSPLVRVGNRIGVTVAPSRWRTPQVGTARTKKLCVFAVFINEGICTAP